MRYRWSLAACAFLCSAQSAAYEEAGHFYTVTAALYEHHVAAHGVSSQRARVIAFCAQLPDLAKEFDAITVRFDLNPFEQITWGLFSSCRGERVRHMVGVQHHMHALTGQSHGLTLASLQSLVQNLDAASRNKPVDFRLACAVGMGVHALGDAFAHSRIDNPNFQYPTGFGHFRDKTHPDLPLFDSQRYGMWERYLTTVDAALSLHLSSSQLTQIDTAGQPLLRSADGDDAYDEQPLVNMLKTLWAQHGEWSPYNPALEQLHAGEWILKQSCASVVQQYKSELGTTIDCRAAYQTYMTAARTAFAAVPAVCPPALDTFPVGDAGDQTPLAEDPDPTFEDR